MIIWNDGCRFSFNWIVFEVDMGVNCEYGVGNLVILWYVFWMWNMRIGVDVLGVVLVFVNIVLGCVGDYMVVFFK